MAVPQESFAVVVGRNCELLRTQIGLTQDEFARYARELGLRWKASSVGDFEAGRSAPKFATVLTVGYALQWALEDAQKKGESDLQGVSLTALTHFDGFVMLTDSFRVTDRTLENACRGYVLNLESPIYDNVKVQSVPVNAVADLLQRSGLTEDRQAKRMGIEPERLAALSLILWRKTFSAERDQRAGPDANAQKRGQVTRAMQAELDRGLASYRTRSAELAKLVDVKVWADGDDQ